MKGNESIQENLGFRYTITFICHMLSLSLLLRMGEQQDYSMEQSLSGEMSKATIVAEDAPYDR